MSAAPLEVAAPGEKKPEQLRIEWLPLVKKISINIFVPFINGIMLGFGEILAHELGLMLGWRNAVVFDPTKKAATDPKRRRKWLFGLR